MAMVMEGRFPQQPSEQEQETSSNPPPHCHPPHHARIGSAKHLPRNSVAPSEAMPRDVFVVVDDEAVALRHAKRAFMVDRVKVTRTYVVAKGCARVRAATPDALDTAISKRTWEKLMTLWRRTLRADETVTWLAEDSVAPTSAATRGDEPCSAVASASTPGHAAASASTPGEDVHIFRRAHNVLVRRRRAHHYGRCCV